MWLLWIVALVTCCGVQSALAQDDEGSLDGHYYYYFGDPYGDRETYDAAKAIAHNITSPGTGVTGYLAVITSSTENDFMYTLGTTGNYRWIGATDTANETVWIWEELGVQFWQETLVCNSSGCGYPVNDFWTAWGGGQPNNFEGLDACLAYRNWKWYDQDCSNANSYLIEFDDYSECFLGEDTCVNGACVNTYGSYTCDCATGWNGTSCDSDVDECAPGGANNCAASGSVCDNTVGSFTCSCANGYIGDGLVCTLNTTATTSSSASTTAPSSSSVSGSSGSAPSTSSSSPSSSAAGGGSGTTAPTTTTTTTNPAVATSAPTTTQSRTSAPTSTPVFSAPDGSSSEPRSPIAGNTLPGNGTALSIGYIVTVVVVVLCCGGVAAGLFVHQRLLTRRGEDRSGAKTSTGYGTTSGVELETKLGSFTDCDAFADTEYNDKNGDTSNSNNATRHDVEAPSILASASVFDVEVGSVNSTTDGDDDSDCSARYATPDGATRMVPGANPSGSLAHGGGGAGYPQWYNEPEHESANTSAPSSLLDGPSIRGPMALFGAEESTNANDSRATCEPGVADTTVCTTTDGDTRVISATYINHTPMVCVGDASTPTRIIESLAPPTLGLDADTTGGAPTRVIAGPVVHAPLPCVADENEPTRIISNLASASAITVGNNVRQPTAPPRGLGGGSGGGSGGGRGGGDDDTLAAEAAIAAAAVPGRPPSSVTRIILPAAGAATRVVPSRHTSSASRSGVSEAALTHSAPQVDGLRYCGVLGKGGQAVIYHYLSLSLGEAVVLKVFKKSNDYEREVAIVQAAGEHENIVRIIYVPDLPAATLALEMAPLGSLGDFMKEGPSSDTVLGIITGVARGLEFLHSRGVCHLDIKPDNILISPGAFGMVVAKITDFGASFVVGRSDLLVDQCTVRYSAPEVVRMYKGGTVAGILSYFALDVYSWAMLVWEVDVGERPFEGLSDDEIIEGYATAPDFGVDMKRMRTSGLAVVVEVCTREAAARPRGFEGVLGELQLL